MVASHANIHVVFIDISLGVSHAVYVVAIKALITGIPFLDLVAARGAYSHNTTILVVINKYKSMSSERSNNQ
jgi:hypothetical protein